MFYVRFIFFIGRMAGALRRSGRHCEVFAAATWRKQTFGQREGRPGIAPEDSRTTAGGGGAESQQRGGRERRQEGERVQDAAGCESENHEYMIVSLVPVVLKNAEALTEKVQSWLHIQVFMWAILNLKILIITTLTICFINAGDIFLNLGGITWFLSVNSDLMFGFCCFSLSCLENMTLWWRTMRD